MFKKINFQFVLSYLGLFPFLLILFDYFFFKILDSNINIWRQLYTEKILKFIEEKNYTSAFSRKILHDNYKTLNLIYENMGHELIKNKMISYYEPTKKRIFNGKFLNSIIQNNQTIFW